MREKFIKHFEKLVRATSKRSNLQTIYQWGVYNGDSIVATLKVLNDLNIKPDNYFGFDTFSGMPENQIEVPDQESWMPGGINVQKYYEKNSVAEVFDIVTNRIKSTIHSLWPNDKINLKLVAGLAEEVDYDLLTKNTSMTPGLLVDVDFDIYGPTKYCLKKYIEMGIIVEGTFIYYDDWGGVIDWQNCTKGESRAHKEICEEFNIEFELLGQFGNSYPHVQRFYQVKKLSLK